MINWDGIRKMTTPVVEPVKCQNFEEFMKLFKVMYEEIFDDRESDAKVST